MWRFGTDATGRVVYDPEGLLSTLGALVDVLIGMLAAAAWRRAAGPGLAVIACGGTALLAIALIMSPVLPVNKRLWTSSFALFTSGVSALMLVGCMLAAMHAALARILAPFAMLGANALLGYMIALAIGIVGLHRLIPDGAGGLSTLPAWAFARIVAIAGNAMLASALYGLIVLLVTLACIAPLHLRGVHLRL